MTLEEFNSLGASEALPHLLRCCGSTVWAELLASRRPFPSMEDLLNASDEALKVLSSDDWKEAFSHHPRIGDLTELREKFAATAQWASKEQSGVEGAPDRVLQELSERNRLYEEKYGYIFIVCAAGKSAEEMLDLMRKRMRNDPVAEIDVAATEQAKITKLRLEKLFLIESN